MPAQQLHLFDPAKPLLSRFGAEFFRAVPAKPGVYIMGGDAERILYIGQSKNLRHRLASYKNARPDRVPRKIIRLVHAVRTIVWEECETAEAARLKENELLRLHRPRFNVMNTYPQAYRFIAVMGEPNQPAFALINEPTSPGTIFGAFKSGCGRAYAALLRLLWIAWHQPTSPHDIPAPLLGPKPPREYRFAWSGTSPENCGRWMDLVKQWLAGESDELVRVLTAALPPPETLCAFQRNLHANDLEILSLFFERGPRRNRTLRHQDGIQGPIIAQEQLDDLLVTATSANPASDEPA